MASTAKRGRWYRRVAAVMALALLATACGGGGDDSGGGGSSAGGDEGTPTPGGKVVYGLEAETADGWFRWISNDAADLIPAEPSRRRIDDRRRVPRGGRRATDRRHRG